MPSTLWIEFPPRRADVSGMLGVTMVARGIRAEIRAEATLPSAREWPLVDTFGWVGRRDGGCLGKGYLFRAEHQPGEPVHIVRGGVN